MPSVLHEVAAERGRLGEVLGRLPEDHSGWLWVLDRQLRHMSKSPKPTRQMYVELAALAATAAEHEPRRVLPAACPYGRDWDEVEPSDGQHC